MLDYPLLEAVAAVDREGSFEGAARALHLTPSAVSQRVKLLEERVGTPLVVRGRPCAATPAGRHLCRHVEQVGLLERDLHGLLPAAGADAGPSRPAVLRVAINADSLATWFPGAMARFAAGEDTLLDVALDDEAHTAEWLHTGQVLAAVAARAKPSPGCRSVPLGGLRYLATASPAFVARHFAGGVDAASLARAPTLQLSRKDELQRRWLRKVCRKDVEPPTHGLPTTQAFLEASLAGVAWCLNPEALARPHLAAGRLVELVRGTALDVPLHWHHARLAPAAVERLTRAVVAEARRQLRPR
ncbi:LysR family transcriptional regulator ArgP [Anaeromyxobacter paludicola]|uniref:Transcriptional regulator ArgP n=1 Tax=Anaeromyxobacter paludicola TaxID=2918171 RepID=A0ABN6N7D3_9BACT|nr:LysR family transcriptional regulator ArgP [Anaeromyxobacter paludicola]BDG08425.1 transcriptional regulator ArgP [Anaeromyxobacter paludicola]